MFHGHLGGSSENVALTAGLCFLLRRVVNLLKNAWDGQQERRLERLQRGKKLRGVGLVTHLHATGDSQDGDETGKNVRHWDEEYGRRSLVHY